MMLILLSALVPGVLAAGPVYGLLRYRRPALPRDEIQIATAMVFVGMAALGAFSGYAHQHFPT